MGSTRSKLIHVDWVGLNPYDGLGWFRFFLTHYGGLGKKIISTRLIHIPKSYLQ